MGKAPARPNYGIDAPEVLRRFFWISGAVFACAATLLIAGSFGGSRLAVGIGIALLWMGGSSLLTPLVMIWGSRVGKLRLRDRLIDGLALRGDESVLDVGCGHGLMLIAAAKRLKSGRAVGVDIWQQADQAGNSPEATQENARLEGVAGRIELRHGDARALPFEDATFDVVLSSWALHNIYDRKEREHALRQVVRVLKPRGRVLLVDIQHAAEYARVLRAEGMRDVRCSGPSFVFLIPTRVVTAMKPEN